MKSIFAALARAPKRVMAAVVLAAAVVIPGALLAYGPDRPEYTVEHAADHVVFNSIKNNPQVGHEFNFVGAREATADEAKGIMPATGKPSTNVWNANDITVQNGKSYVVRMYVHNNGKNADIVAKNVMAYFAMDSETKVSHDIQGTIAASNASPARVYDHVTMKSDKAFNLRYLPGSLRYENNKAPAGGWSFAGDNDVFSTGVQLGYDKMNGEIPGCFQYDGYLSFIVTPQFSSSFDVSKQVKIAGTTGWKETVAAKAGDTVEFLLQYKNTGATQQDNVTYVDKLPKGLSYVEGSATYAFKRDGKDTVEPAKNNVTTTGVNVGSYAPGATSWLKFSAKVAHDKDLACGINTLRNIVSVKPETGNYTAEEDDASVTVSRECVNQVEKTKVCDTSTAKIVEVEKSKVGTGTYTTNFALCDTPTEMPETGITDVVAVLGAGSLVLSGAYFLNSRRMLS